MRSSWSGGSGIAASCRIAAASEPHGAQRSSRRRAGRYANGEPDRDPLAPPPTPHPVRARAGAGRVQEDRARRDVGAGRRAGGQEEREGAGPRERGEYSALPDGGGRRRRPTRPAPSRRSPPRRCAAARTARRASSRTRAELDELSRGASPKYMNGQFRYYLAGVSVVQPQGECKRPLLGDQRWRSRTCTAARRSAIYGEFTFSRSVGGDGSSLTETVGVPYHADIIGPFSNKQGGLVYATAYAAADRRRARPRPLGADRRGQPAAAQGLVQARGLLLRRRHASTRQRTGKVAAAARSADLRRQRRREPVLVAAQRRVGARRAAIAPARAAGRPRCCRSVGAPSIRRRAPPARAFVDWRP